MSVEREGSNTSENALNTLRLIEKLDEHNKISVFECENADRSKDFSEEEYNERFVAYHSMGKQLVEIEASNLHELKLKAQAFCKLVSPYNDQNDIREFIATSCETQEAAAFSFVRDFLKVIA